eukprot:2267931-Prorocentrum_lima.AAC.1
MALHLPLWMHTPTHSHRIRRSDHASTRRTTPELHLLGPILTYPHTGQWMYDHPATKRTLATSTDAYPNG